MNYVEHGWRYVQIFIAIPAGDERDVRMLARSFDVRVVVQILCASVLPDSPRFLVRQGRIKEARATLTVRIAQACTETQCGCLTVAA